MTTTSTGGIDDRKVLRIFMYVFITAFIIILIVSLMGLQGRINEPYVQSQAAQFPVKRPKYMTRPGAPRKSPF